MENVIIKNPESASYLDTWHLYLTSDQCNLLEFLSDNGLLAESVEFEVIDIDDFQRV